MEYCIAIMFSILKPGFVYTDITNDITENDVDVVSDEWNMDGRIVYRGSRDPRYTHANVYWLYDDDLSRVGCTEHDIENHANYQILWFRDNEFGTLLQEDGWVPNGDVWSRLPNSTFERFVNEGWTTPEGFLEQCLPGTIRAITPKMLIDLPKLYKCAKCEKKSLKPILDCASQEISLDFPDKNDIYFIDEDMVLYQPPLDSIVWSILPVQLLDDDSLSRVPVEA